MTYVLNKTDGNILAVVNSGTVDSTTADLAFVGKGYAAYGEIVNENFVKLLENFSSSTPPVSPISGQIWFNSSTQKIMVFDGVAFRSINAVSTQANEPLRRSTGDLWWDTSTDQLKIRTSSNQWQVIYPLWSNAQGLTGSIPETIPSTTGNVTVNSMYVGGTRAGIWSNTNFIPSPTLSGFGNISSGLNLMNGIAYNGNAAVSLNSLRLGNLLPNQFIRGDQDATTTADLTIGGELTSNTLVVDVDATIAGALNADNIVVIDTLITPKISTGSPSVTGIISGTWNLEYGSTLNSTFADLAEEYEADLAYEPGTVLVFGGSKEVTTTSIQSDSRVAGVVSTDPAWVLNTTLSGTKIALQGRVPCKVTGPVNKGDLIVTSAIPGVAMAQTGNYVPGSVIGKSISSCSSLGIRLIEVAVGRL